MIQQINIRKGKQLSEYKTYAHLSGMVDDLVSSSRPVANKLRDKTVWMINSTANGGGVAEMMPKMVGILRQLGVRTEWLVFSPENEAFFQLTKRIHNLIHDLGKPGFTPDEKALYEASSKAAAGQLERMISPDDIMVVHDPQPLGAGAELIARRGIRSIWRCHIGLDKQTRQTESAWSFLKPYAETYDHAVFSTPEYVPSFFGEKTSIITPAIDPLSQKNRDILSPELIGILYKCGILQNGHHRHLNPPWKRKALRLNANGKFIRTSPGDGFELLFRPTVTQISRWDRLKGWDSLIEGFVALKRKYRNNGHKNSFCNLRMSATQLVLAGPEPAAVQDDPEGKGVLDDLRTYYKSLPIKDQKDISILSLPMSSRSQNHLMVNALQRCSSMVVQNSLQEGFGLTATEAMWKRVPVLGTKACGLRRQIRDGKDGLLTTNPSDPMEIAANVERMLAKPKRLEKLGRKAQKRVHKNFLIFNQIEKWMQCLDQLVA
ncbi:MAG: glycosyltransferase [Desulfobacterales bacterium]